MSLYLEENKNNINTVTKEGEGTHIRGYHALLTEINKNTENRLLFVVGPKLPTMSRKGDIFHYYAV